MEISILGYKFNLEILILIGVIYLIMVGHLFCGCCNFGIMEGFDASGNVATQIQQNLQKLKTNLQADQATAQANLQAEQATAQANQATAQTTAQTTAQANQATAQANKATAQTNWQANKGAMKSDLQTQIAAGGSTSSTTSTSTSAEGFTGANINNGQSSPYDLSTDDTDNSSSWSSPNMTVIPGQPLSAGVKQFLAREPQPTTLPKGEMLMFATTPFKPECCPNTYSTSAGCACMTGEQYNALKTRFGNNVPYSEY